MSAPTLPALTAEMKHRIGVRRDAEPSDSWYDAEHDCVVYVFDGERYLISKDVMREWFPPVDPMVEAFTLFALALHENRKERERRVLP